MFDAKWTKVAMTRRWIQYFPEEVTTNLLFGQIFLKTTWKWKKIGRGRGVLEDTYLKFVFVYPPLTVWAAALCGLSFFCCNCEWIEALVHCQLEYSLAKICCHIMIFNLSLLVTCIIQIWKWVFFSFVIYKATTMRMSRYTELFPVQIHWTLSLLCWKFISMTSWLCWDFGFASEMGLQLV